MNKDIGKYIFVDVVYFLLFSCGLVSIILLFSYLPKTYYLNLIVGGASTILFLKMYLPWVKTVEQSLFITLNVDSSKQVSFVFWLVAILLLISSLVKGEYLIGGLVGLIILYGIYKEYKRRKPKPYLSEGEYIEVGPVEKDVKE